MVVGHNRQILPNFLCLNHTFLKKLLFLFLLKLGKLIIGALVAIVSRNHFVMELTKVRRLHQFLIKPKSMARFISVPVSTPRRAPCATDRINPFSFFVGYVIFGIYLK